MALSSGALIEAQWFHEELGRGKSLFTRNYYLYRRKCYSRRSKRHSKPGIWRGRWLYCRSITR